MVQTLLKIEGTSGALYSHSDHWEPFISVQGNVAGEVLWLRNTTVGENLLQSGIWRVLPGQLPETVDRLFPGNETIHVLEGEVTIEIEGRAPLHLRPGDTAYFDKGIPSVWTFKMPFRKVFHIS